MSTTSLKRDGICPTCQTRVFWHIERASSGFVYTINRYDNRRLFHEFELYLCKSCGLMESYALDIEKLKENPKRGIRLINNEPEAGLR